MASNVRFIDALKVGQFKGNKGDQGPTGSGFPFTGSARITGSLDLTGSLAVDGNITASGNISASKLTVNTASISKIVDGPDGNANAGITIITSDNTSLEFSDTIIGSTEEYDLTLTSGGALKINNAGSKFSGSAGNITASGNISASGDIFARNLSSSGNFSSSGDLEIRNLTASGNISASGAIIGKNFTGSSFTGSFFGDGSGLTNLNSGSWDGNFTGSARITGSLDLTGSLDVSKNISASNFLLSGPFTSKIQAKTLDFLENTTISDIISVDGLQAKFGDANGADITTLAGKFIQLKTSGSTILQNKILISSTGGGTTMTIDTLTGNLTSSGNISASGNIISDTYSGSINTNYFGDEFNANGNDANSGFTISALGSKPQLFANSDRLQIGSVLGTHTVFNNPLSASSAILGTSILLSSGSGNTYPTPSTDANLLVLENKNSAGKSGLTIFSDNGATGNIYFGDEQSNQVAGITADNTSGNTDLFFTTNGNNERLRINGSGNVGIGTTTPNEKLQVEGNISASGDITLDNVLAFGGSSNNITTSDNSANLSIIPGGILNLGTVSTDRTCIGRTGNVSYQTRFFGGTTDEVARVSSGSFKAFAPITASSNISASGNIIGASITSSGGFVGVASGTTCLGYFGSDENNIRLEAGGDTFICNTVGGIDIIDDKNQQITLNGNDITFFNSGSCLALKLTKGNITASGNISGSGTSSFSDGRFSGKVGIGNINPQRTLDVKTSLRVGEGDAVLDVSNADFIVKLGDIAGAGDNTVFTVDDTNQKFTFATGKVGIGTTSPTEKLQVEGNISASGNLILQGHITSSGHLSSSGDLEIRNLTASGNISASGDLEIRNLTASGNITASGTGFFEGGIRIGGTNGTTTEIVDSFGEKMLFGENDLTVCGKHINAQFGIFARSAATGRQMGIDGSSTCMGLYTAGQEKVSITQVGHMGIGTTNPQELLTLDDGNDSRLLFSLPSAFYGAINVRNDNNNASRNLILQNQGGNVGIGLTTPTASLHISGSTSNIRLLQVGDNYLVVTGSNGNIGIGTTSPSTLLQLSGSGGNSSGLSFTNGSGEFLRQYFQDENADSNFLITYDGTGGAEITLQHDGDVILNGTNGDNVGIGTSTPNGKLGVSGSVNVLGPNGHITASGNISASGFISASSFSGEGTGLTGVVLGTGVANFIPQFTNANTIQTASQFCMGSNVVQFGTSLTDDTARTICVKAQCYAALRVQNEDNAYSFGTRPGGAFAFTNVNGNQFPFQLSCGALSNAFFIGNGNGGRNISFATHGTCGNVGIGWTNTFTTPARLTLTGHSTTDIIRVYDSSSAANQLMTFDYQGNLGIGVTSPGEKLEVDGNLKLKDGFCIFNNTGNYWQRIRTEDAAPDSTNAFNFETRNGSGDFIPHVTIQNSGNVGIGTTTASALLHISGSTSNNRLLQIGDNYLVVTGSNGNVGIGTTSPSEKLSVTGSGRVTRIESSDDSVPLVVENSGGGHARVGFRGSNSTSDYHVSAGAIGTSFALRTDDTERMRITCAGNLGLNTTSPGEMITVRGCCNFIAAEHPSYPWGGTNPLGIRMGVAQGAGTNCSGTSGLLDFFRWRGSGTNFVNARIAQNINDLSTAYNYGLNFMVDSVSTCITASTSRLYISPNGLIGVGTIEPPETFTVEGNISASGGITSSGVIISETITSGATGSFGTTGTAGSVILTDTSGESRITAKNNHLVLRTQRDVDDIKFQGGDSTTTYAVILGDTGNFGIGTTNPSEKLSVSGNITATSITASGRIHISDYIEHIGDTNAKFGFSGTDNFEIKTAGNTRLTVNSSGNVGIGCTSPGCKLDICGISRVDELNHSQYKLSTNDLIDFNTQPKTYAAPPNAYLYHDVFGFDYSYTRTQETSSNGTDFGARDLQKKLFSQKQDQSVTVIESGDVAVRFTFTNVAFILPQFLNFAFTYVSGDIDKQLLVETGDGTSYTTRHTSSATSGVKTVSAFIDYYGGDTHMRITITKADPTSTQTIKMSSLKLMTARAGDQGQGMEFQYPYTYDEDRNIGVGFTQGTPSEDDTRLGIKGSGSDATSNAILAKNSSNTTIFTARNDGLVSVGSNFVVSGSQIDFTNVPTSDPGIAGRLFRDGTDLKISVG